ncbi:MAG TPA: FecR domain-containing protein [Chitinophaga sp.]|uniref:FecR family protein n=1 Tax=Chitinophaga sp. TaxID=1869181 RepID=UPI002DBCD739|nr:FecR domain-containing protein [Chitinophaga sp.]HEU4551990.1 FecR domain-containing protein [Chitinophaga sp.]
MKYETARQLIEKYLDNALSREERQQLLDMTEAGNDETLIRLFQEMLANEAFAGEAADGPRMKQSLLDVLAVDKNPDAGKVHSMHRRKSNWMRYAAAAAILACALGTFLWLQQKSPIPAPLANKTAAPATDILPGGKKAQLTLADGTVIQLDSAGNGALATQPGSQVVNKNGEVIYTPNGNAQDMIAYNTLRTPRGGIYQLSLPDGSKVWLNAASSISYPVAFRGRERLVEIAGEAYFEVAPHANMPFKVKVNDKSIIEVLGTAFNVMAYHEAPFINTTLLQGAVRVTNNGKQVTLQPGQQAKAAAGQLSVKTLDQAGISKALAWKEGRFNFQDASLQEIMMQLSRWYDIEVVYEKDIPDIEFIGEIERSLPLSDVLKGLKMSGVNFRLENGKRLIVSP